MTWFQRQPTAKTSQSARRPVEEHRAQSWRVVAAATALTVAATTVTITSPYMAQAIVSANEPTDLTQSPGIDVYRSDFEGSPGGTLIQDFVGNAASNNATYTADTPWLNGPRIAGSTTSGGNCNGVIVNPSVTLSFAQCNEAATGANIGLRALASALGRWNAGKNDGSVTNTNSALAAFTSTNPGAGFVNLRTRQEIPTIATHYYLPQISMAAVNCSSNAPVYRFIILQGTTETTLGGDDNGCTTTPNANYTINGYNVRVSNAFSGTSFRATGAGIGVKILNMTGSGAGNDAAIDDLRFVDVTPKLAVIYTQAQQPVGAPTPLTFRAVNTTDNASKADFGYTYTLPAGTRFAGATPTVTSTCGNGTWTISGNTITVTGADLTSGSASCNITVNVTSDTAGTATNPASLVSNLTSIIAPTAATTTVYTLPTATPDTSTTPQNTPVTVKPFTNDTPAASTTLNAAFVPSTFGMLDPADGIYKTTVSIPGQGTYVFDPATSGVTFTPIATFTGTATPITYRATDPYGNQITSTITITVIADEPVAVNDSATTPQGIAVTLQTLANDRGNDLKVAETRILDVTGAPVTSLTVANQGTWTVNTATGDITFTPLPGFTGVTTPITYRITDKDNQTATAQQTVTITTVTPTAVNDARTTPQNTPISLNPLTNDAAGNASVPLQPQSVLLTTQGLPAGSTVSADGKTLTVPGQGTYVVAADGTVTFTPLAAFAGTATPVTYTVADANGTRATALITITVTAVAGTAAPDYATTPQNTPVTLTPLGNDSALAPLDPASVRLTTTGAPSGSVLSADGKTLTVPGQGTYTVQPNGTVIFSPLPAFAGVATPITYTAADTNGTQISSTLNITVTPVAGTANPDTAATPRNTPVVVDPLVNDSALAPLDPSTVTFTEPASATVTVSADGKTLTIQGVGTYVVLTDGTVRFTPVATYTGVAPAVQYSVADTNGTRISSTIVITVFAVDPITQSAPQGSTVTVAPILHETDPTTVFYPATGQPAGATVSADGRTLTVPGEGTWTVNTTTGAMTFTPLAGFTQEPTPVLYSARHVSGAAATPASITIREPDVSPITAMGAQGQPITANPIVDADTIASTATFPVAGQPATAIVSTDGKTLTIPGQGVWTIGATGAITFTPAAGFQGDPTPVLYTAADAAGNLAIPALVTFTYPDVTALTNTGTQGQPITTAPILDAQATPGSVYFPVAGQPAGSTLSASDKTLTVPGEGVWTINATTGAITFTPEAGFQGDPTPVLYSATDVAGNAATPATVTYTYPDVSDISQRGDQGQPVTIASVRDAQTLATTVVFPTAGQPSGAVVSADGKTLTVPNEGTWQISATGDLTFTPLSGYQGSPTPVLYTGADAAGHLAEPATATVFYPDVQDLISSGDQGEPITVTPPIGALIDPSTTTFATGTQPATAQISADGKTMTIPGEGVWSISPTGAITFTPDAGFTGDPTPVTYTATDAVGNSALPATITLTYPDVSPVSGSGSQGQPVSVAPIVDDTTLAATTRFAATGQPAGASVSADGRTLSVPGEGTWQVDTATGVMTFTPEAGFQGDPLPVLYFALDAQGNAATPATVTVAYPNVNDILQRGEQGTPVTLNPDMDANLLRSTVVFSNVGLPAGATLSADGKSITVPGEGSWSIDPTSGAITFTPALGFDGDPTPVRYTASDAAGNTAEPATVTVLYPDVDNVARTGAEGQPVTVPTSKDADVVLGSVTFPTAGQPVGAVISSDGKTMTIPGQGTWTVDPATDAITFTPDPALQGSPNAIVYTGADSEGNLSQPATVVVTYPNVADLIGSGTPGSAVTLPLVDTANVDVTSVFFPEDGQLAGAVITNGGKTMSIPGQGTWTIDPVTGAITFTPDPELEGDPTSVRFAARDNDGNLTAPATATVTYPNVEPLMATGDQGQPVTMTIVGTEHIEPTTLRFPAEGQPTGAIVSTDGLTLTVPGEGTWVLDRTAGTITFTPEAGFQGDPGVVVYTGDDAAGHVAVPATVTVKYPDVSPISGSGTQGNPTALNPIIDAETLPSSLVFTPPAAGSTSVLSGDGKILTVPGEGVWSIDPTTGVITFTPEAGYQGDPTPVTYFGADAQGNVSEPALVTLTFPDVSDIAGTGTQDQPVTLNVILDAEALPTTVRFPLDGQPTGSTLSTDGKTLTVPGEGVWSIDLVTGAITFTPEAGFQGDPTPVLYTASNAAGQAAQPATATVVYPDVRAVSSSGDQGEPVTLAPNLDAQALANTVQFPAAGQPAGSSVDAAGTTLTVPGEGVWRVDPVTGAMTFTPDAGFQGSPQSVLYTAADVDGNLAEPATVTVTYPDVSPASATNTQGQPTVLTPVLAEGTRIDTLEFPAAGQPAGAIITTAGGTLTVPGEGVWRIDRTTGTITFTPEAGFQGDPTPVQFWAADDFGNQATPELLTVTYPDVSPISGAGTQGQPVSLPPIMDAQALPSSVTFPAAGQPAGSQLSSDGKTLTVPGEGVWSVDPTTGVITFTPEAGFQGEPTPVLYTATDADGHLALPALVQVTYPNISDATGAGTQGQPVSVVPELSGSADANTLAFPITGQPAGAVVDAAGTTMVVAGQGTWTIDRTTGEVTFTPEAGYQGDPAPVLVTVADANGNLAEPATVTITYPDVSDIATTEEQGRAATMPLVFDAQVVPSTLMFPVAGQPAGATLSADQLTLTVAGEGTWVIDPVAATMTFTPEVGFQGDPTPVQYVGADAAGDLAAPATATVRYPDVSDVAVTAAQDATVTVPLVLDADAVAATLMFPVAGQPAGSVVSADNLTLSVPGEGVWRMDPAAASAIFEPEVGFQGDPSPIQYTATDADGNRALPATITVLTPDVSDIIASGTQGQPVTVAAVLDADAVATTVRFVTAGQPAGAIVSADGKTLTVPGQGVWSVDPVTGAMTFTPEAGFQGDPTPVLYTASDAQGNAATPASVTVTYPDVADISNTGVQGEAVTLPVILDAQALPATVVLVMGSVPGSVLSSDGKMLTVPGEGVWSVDLITGALTFVPAAGFQGDPTPVQYTAADAAGHLALPATANVTYPDVADIVTSGVQGQPVTVAAALDAQAVPASVRWAASGQPAGGVISADGLTLTVPGEGTWSINGTTGALTFTPEAGFTGDPTPVRYTATDAAGHISEPATVTITYPDVSDVSGVGTQGEPVSVLPILDAQALATSVQFPTAGQPAGAVTSADGKTLTVPGEGVWSVDPVTGAMTFTPEVGFQGDPTPIVYTAADAAGNLAEPASVTVLYPDVSNVSATGAQGQPVTIATSLDAQALATTVTFPVANQPAGATVSADGRTLTVPGEGVWTIDPTTGAATFTPEATFKGSPTPVMYVATDAAGNLSVPATISVTYPNINDLSASGVPTQPVSVQLTDAQNIDPTSVRFPVAGQVNTATVAPDGLSMTIASEGTWTIDPQTGTITFTPTPGFEGDPTVIKYEARDNDGNLAEPATVTIVYPQVNELRQSAAQGATVLIPANLDADIVPASVVFVTEGQPVGAVVSADGKTLTMPGQGTWVIDPVTADVTFTPEPGFVDDPNPVLYTGSNAAGVAAIPDSITVLYPDVANISARGAQGQPTTIEPIIDSHTLLDSVRFVADGQPSGAVVSDNGRTLTVPGEGVWVFDPATGLFTFTPEAGFLGDPTPVLYTAADADGNLATPATITVLYPDVSDVTGTGTQGAPVTIKPILDVDAVPTTVTFPEAGQPTGSVVSADGKTLTVPGEGVWTIDPVTGDITFTPEPGFQGDPTPVKFTATDADGNLAIPATITVLYPDVSDLTATGTQGTPVTIKPILDADAVPTTVTFPEAGQPTGSVVSEDGKTLTVPGEGIWTIDPVTGDITFTPEPGFQGDPTPVKFTATDADGNLAAPATITVKYPDVSDVTGTGTQGSPVTIKPILDADAVPTTVTFPEAGQPTGSVVSADGKTLTVPGEGIWTIDPVTGDITFTPEPGFQGDPTPVKFTATDADGNLAAPATITVKYPDVSDVTGTGTQGSPVTIKPILDADAVPSTVVFPQAGQPDGSVVSEDGKTLTIPGEGVWTIDPVTGDITFTPEPGFQGDPTPVKFTATDADGNLATPGTITVKYPDVSDVTGSGGPDKPVTLKPDLGPNVVPSTVVFPPAGQPDGSVVSEDGKTLTVPGEGVWTIDPVTGDITFTPEPGFSGTTTPIKFVGSDVDGNVSEPGLATVTIAAKPVPPTPKPTTPAPKPTPTGGTHIAPPVVPPVQPAPPTPPAPPAPPAPVITETVKWLARTGADIGLPLGLGALLVMVGAALRWGSRKRYRK